jgi:FAD/FMN-containing dehydrogenase
MRSPLDPAAVADDIGHIIHRTPARVVRPGDQAEVEALIRWAAARGMHLAARGRGHSTFGRSQVEGGVVLDMAGMAHVGPVDESRVRVGAGATWKDVLAATLPYGLSPPVVPDYLDLSVAGTVVVGGVGSMTSRHGLVCDNVAELRIVTATGEWLTCSRVRNVEAFDAVRAGLGQIGVITEVDLELVPAPESVNPIERFYPDLASMLADVRSMVRERRFDEVQAAVVRNLDGHEGWIYRVEAADHNPARLEPDACSYLEWLERLAPLAQLLDARHRLSLPNPWLMTFIGDSQVDALAGAELNAPTTPADLGPMGRINVSPIETEAIRAPLFRAPAEELCWTFNLVRMPPVADADRLLDVNAATYARVREAGGTLYPVSALPMSPDAWRGHFGPSAFASLEAAKSRYDPDRMLTPGYDVFGAAVPSLSRGA